MSTDLVHYNARDQKIFDTYKREFGEQISHDMVSEFRLTQEFVTMARTFDNKDLNMLVGAGSLTVYCIPHYYVLSYLGRTPYLFDLLKQMNTGLITGLALVKDDLRYQVAKGTSITALAYDHLAWHYPTPEKLEFIKNIVGERRVLELGCGRGLITSLLLGKGVDVVATDSGTWEDDNHSKGVYFINYHKLDNRAAISKYAHDPTNPQYCPVLLACWAIAEIPWSEFTGNEAIIIGNPRSCAGYPDITQWKLVDSFAGEQWGVDKLDPDTINYYCRIASYTS